MKMISTPDYELIQGLLSEGPILSPPAILEKDPLGTEALHAVTTTLNSDVRPAFCGGTSLSKAHGLIARMSEDIDLKLVVTEGLSRNARNKLLSGFKKDLASTFEELGFNVPPEQTPLVMNIATFACASTTRADFPQSPACLDFPQYGRQSWAL